jgi:hypothetical protein
MDKLTQRKITRYLKKVIGAPKGFTITKQTLECVDFTDEESIRISFVDLAFGTSLLDKRWEASIHVMAEFQTFGKRWPLLEPTILKSDKAQWRYFSALNKVHK